MPQQPHASDYEPVTRTGGTAPCVDQGFDGDQCFDAPLRNAASAHETSTAASAPVAIPAKQTTISAVARRLKKGHLVTYIVLMTFTFLVFFRPYEIFPSFK